MKIAKFIQKFIRDEDGVTAIEYGLIAALIAVITIGAITLVGTNLKLVFATVSTALFNASSA